MPLFSSGAIYHGSSTNSAHLPPSRPRSRLLVVFSKRGSSRNHYPLHKHCSRRVPRTATRSIWCRQSALPRTHCRCVTTLVRFEHCTLSTDACSRARSLLRRSEKPPPQSKPITGGRTDGALPASWQALAELYSRRQDGRCEARSKPGHKDRNNSRRRA